MSATAFKILLVEDDPKLSEKYRTALKAAGFIVQVCDEGMCGIVKAVEFAPDLIILDLLIPQMDGFEFLRAIRENSSLQTKIVVNSNLTAPKHIHKALELGADEYLKKSDFTVENFVHRIKVIAGKIKVPSPPEKNI